MELSAPPIRTHLKRLARRLPARLQAGPPLVAAAAAGQTARIEALLEAGAPIDACNASGQSALHLAARCSRIEAAALLLARGASHRLQDARGRRPLDPSNVDPETLHRIRQRLRRTALRGDDPLALSFGPEGDPWLAQLRRDGIVRIPDLIAPDQLAALQAEFAGFVEAIERARTAGGGEKRSYDEEEHYWPDDLAWISNNAFKHSPSLARLFCDPRLTALARSYYGRRAFITRGVAMRYLPLEERHKDMFGWHHDLEDRRLKALVLLTDLPASGQVMSYVRGSHVLQHPYRMFFRNGVPLEHCRRALGPLRIFETAGRAGDVFFFDSNGVHRGNRRPDAPTRDTFFVEYGIDASNIWGGDPPRALVNSLAASGDSPDGSPFAELLAADRKWERPQTRRHPSWIENLYAIDAWRV
ncbi:MAG: ankyrin repeat domain-containing protein [Myxococcota bacterium]